MQNLDKLLEAIRADYAKYTPNHPNMVDSFNKELRVTVGKKYIKIISRGCVWGFVVNTETDSTFNNGDILKAAGWNAPARNKARGNVIAGDFSWVRWTGPEYL